MWEEQITVGPTEQQRAWVLNRVLSGQWTMEEAAQTLGISVRHVRRLKAAYAQAGIGALVHRNRGRRPPHALSDALKTQVRAFAQTTYTGVNDQHLTEL